MARGRRRRLDVDQLWASSPEQVLVLQAGDLHLRRDPAVALPVQPDEDVALRQVGAIQVARRMRPRAELEEDRREPQLGDGLPRDGAFGASSWSVELTKTRTRWSGVRMGIEAAVDAG